MSDIVELTEAEARWAESIADERSRLASEAGRARRNGLPSREEDGSVCDRMGAMAELAFAIHRGVEWKPEYRKPDTEVGDVGRTQIRATKYRSGRLPLHPADRDDAPFRPGDSGEAAAIQAGRLVLGARRQAGGLLGYRPAPSLFHGPADGPSTDATEAGRLIRPIAGVTLYGPSSEHQRRRIFAALPWAATRATPKPGATT